jgi:hypothetical protein
MLFLFIFTVRIKSAISGFGSFEALRWIGNLARKHSSTLGFVLLDRSVIGEIVAKAIQARTSPVRSRESFTNYVIVQCCRLSAVRSQVSSV